MTDWDPGTYDRFRGHRLRPALDLIRALPEIPDGPLVDLGCGNGAAGAALKRLGHPLVGVDNSATMLAVADEAGVYDALMNSDIGHWEPHVAPALIYSNAALHWLPDHATLLPRLAAMPVPRGVLAVQMPHQNNAPSHRLWVQLCDELFPGRLDHHTLPGALDAAAYHRLLAPLGELSLWETDYYQELPAEGPGHPVRHFTEAAFARPILGILDPTERERLVAAYDSVIGSAYPAARDGSVLFPLRRLFFTLRRAD
ncbi:methyltransferase domain-containing protein [Allosediminivita pacifica]|nr:methyltransferase domain-containing protein [Allosediminivita pacifica]